MKVNQITDIRLKTNRLFSDINLDTCFEYNRECRSSAPADEKPSSKAEARKGQKNLREELDKHSI
jgi:hypothetical protein